MAKIKSKRGKPLKYGDVTRHNILVFIAKFITDHGYSPSVREIQEGIGLASTNSVHVQLKAMRDMGLVHMQDNTARSVRPTSPTK
jgi:repressor LexA